MISALTQILIELARSKRTGEQIERELDQHFGDFEAAIEGHSGETVRLQLESIRVRPQFHPKKVTDGVWKLESWDGFTEYDEARTKPTLRERFKAIREGNWITIVRFNIRDGDIDDIRPDGLNLRHNSTILSHREPGRQIKPIETSTVQSDKLKLKIRYEGSMGEYRRQLSEAIDALRYIQRKMESSVLYFLIELLYQSQWEDSDSTWGESEENAEKLGEYLVGRKIDTDELAEIVTGLKENMESEYKQKEDRE